MTGEASGEAATFSKTKRRLWPRLLIGLACAVVVLLIAGELFARFALGLGDPPLVERDPTIVYLFQPNQLCHRFGHVIKYNQYSMRSEDFPAHKSDPHELRVMMFGNSIINGGALTDQSQIASEMLEGELSKDLGRPVVVGNISAGGWGPPNELAYARRYGLFDADVVLIVCTTRDYANVPTAGLIGVDPSLPDTKPKSALWEGFTRYFLPWLRSSVQPHEGYLPSTTVDPKDVKIAEAALHELIAMARQSGAKVLIAHHPDKGESSDAPPVGAVALKEFAQREGVPLIEFGPALRAAQSRGEDIYSDGIHLTAAGQRVILSVIQPAIEEALKAPVTTTQAGHDSSGQAKTDKPS